jgi:phosphoglucomutase
MGFDDDARIVFRLSGTGTEGATSRVYLERLEPRSGAPGPRDAGRGGPLIAAAERIAGIAARTGGKQPTVLT